MRFGPHSFGMLSISFSISASVMLTAVFLTIIHTASSDVQTSADVPNLNGFYRSLFLSVFSVSSVSNFSGFVVPFPARTTPKPSENMGHG